MLFILLPQKQFYSTLCDQKYHNVFITKLKRVCLMAYTVLLHKNPIQTFAQVMHGFSHMHNSLQTKDTRDKEGFMYQTESSISLCWYYVNIRDLQDIILTWFFIREKER